MQGQVGVLSISEQVDVQVRIPEDEELDEEELLDELEDEEELEEVAAASTAQEALISL